ncbi:MAG: hypothetical protein NZ551_05010, partial [Microscillaceae bacterium]|nr:hypothetical protein [Microscillaceae bacterium]MDW8460554.1 type ISP restriction/modification enzyme [Cytophagales bacterium]
IFQEKNIFEKRAKRTEKQLRKAIEEADRNFEKAWAEFQRAKTIEGKDKAGLEEYLAKVEEAKALKELLRNEELRMQSQESDYVKIPNFTREFEDYIHAHYNTELTPEQILGYIYAILHCPNYREKYNEFLKTDYPKIPFLADLTTFQQLSNMGNELIKAHLLDNTYIESIKDKYPKVDFIGEGNFEITKVDFIKNKVWINSNQYFDNVPENIWNFKIGAYYPMQKYLRERKGATISLEDLHVIENQIIAIAFTIEKMNELENLTKHLI